MTSTTTSRSRRQGSPATAPPRGADRFRADLQGLRAVAVALVVLDHVDLLVPGGFVGVDAFFVLSGFLITGHLLREVSRTGRIVLAAFWARRVRRLLPAALLVAAVTFVVGTLLLPPLDFDSLTRMARATALYLPNMALASHETDYLAGAWPSPFQHYWSLGVEEQFYLVWPLAVLLFVAVANRVRVPRAARVAPALLTGLAVLVSFGLCLVVTGVSQPWGFFSLPTRAWEFGVGALVAMALPAVDRWRTTSGAGRVVTAVAGWSGLLLLVGAAVSYDEGTRYPGVATLLPVTAAALVLVSGGGRGSAAVLLDRPALQYLGAISYSLYLWHWPVIVIAEGASGRSLSTVEGLVAIAVSIVAAHLTLRFVEDRWRHPHTSRRATPTPTPGRRQAFQTIGVGALGSVAVIALTVALTPVAASRPLATSASAPAADVTGPPIVPDAVPADLVPTLDAAADSVGTVDGCDAEGEVGRVDTRCRVGDPGGLTVALFGDSHAGHWYPALEAWAEDASTPVLLRPSTKANCPSVPVGVLSAGNPSTSCDAWRDDVLANLNADPPDVVVISNSSHHRLSDRRLDPVEAWVDAVDELVAALPAESRVVVLADTPTLAESAPRCLSRWLDDVDACGVDRAVGIDPAFRSAEHAAFRSHGVPYVELDDHFCSASRCAPINGSTLMYRDASHLTAAWTVQLARPVGEAVIGAKVPDPR